MYSLKTKNSPQIVDIDSAFIQTTLVRLYDLQDNKITEASSEASKMFGND